MEDTSLALDLCSALLTRCTAHRKQTRPSSNWNNLFIFHIIRETFRNIVNGWYKHLWNPHVKDTEEAKSFFVLFWFSIWGKISALKKRLRNASARYFISRCFHSRQWGVWLPLGTRYLMPLTSLDFLKWQEPFSLRNGPFPHMNYVLNYSV